VLLLGTTLSRTRLALSRTRLAMDGAATPFSDDGLVEHPVLFMNEDMITIQVCVHHAFQWVN
jgi:hypothetical protein